MNIPAYRPDMFATIRPELDLVEETWQNCFRGKTNSTLEVINGFFQNSTGKRLRPALTILAAGAVLGKRPTAVQTSLIMVASAIELLHTASLIHDDTIDSALIRHNQPTINARFGSQISIAFGDYVYSWALTLVSATHEPALFSCFSQRTFHLCEGELLQIIERNNLEMTPQQYFSIIERKTASLFALSGESGALVAAPGDSGKVETMRNFGLNFGMAYQIIDDIRDLVADKINLGKEPGADFHVAELTLPLIFLLNDDVFGAEVRTLFKAEDRHRGFERIRQLAEGSQALAQSRTKALQYLEMARAGLSSCADSIYKNHLNALCSWLEEKL